MPGCWILTQSYQIIRQALHCESAKIIHPRQFLPFILMSWPWCWPNQIVIQQNKMHVVFANPPMSNIVASEPKSWCWQHCNRDFLPTPSLGSVSASDSDSLRLRLLADTFSPRPRLRHSVTISPLFSANIQSLSGKSHKFVENKWKMTTPGTLKLL